MTDIREVIARAICRVQLNGGDPDQHAVRWNGTEMEPQSFPAWRDYRDEADHVISALDKAGMTWTWKEPTEAMMAAGVKANDAYVTEVAPCSAFRSLDCYRAMLAAKGE